MTANGKESQVPLMEWKGDISPTSQFLDKINYYN